MFSKILLASDGSNCALSAARAAAKLAKQFGAELTVLHAFTLPASLTLVPDAPSVGMDQTTIERYTEEVQDSVVRRTGKVLEEAEVPYTVRQEMGNPAEVIIRVAEREGFDLIVIGSRGLSEFTSFFLGSVSDRVVHHAHCQVLVVKGDRAKACK